MIRRLFILVALLMPLPAAALLGGSGPASAAQMHAYTAQQPSQAGPADFVFCSNERSTCAIHGTADIAFGANGKFYYAYGVTGSIPCTDAVFGDPDVGVEKACYVRQDTGPTRYAFCVSEGRLCTFSGHANVAFGADGKFSYEYGITGPISCSDPVFGDPDAGAVKGCYIKPDIGPAGYTFCATEGQTCTVSGTEDVAFGADGKFHYQNGVTGSIACTDAVFGDPDVGVDKACYTKPV